MAFVNEAVEEADALCEPLAVDAFVEDTLLRDTLVALGGATESVADRDTLSDAVEDADKFSDPDAVDAFDIDALNDAVVLLLKDAAGDADPSADNDRAVGAVDALGDPDPEAVWPLAYANSKTMMPTRRLEAFIGESCLRFTTPLSGDHPVPKMDAK